MDFESFTYLQMHSSEQMLTSRPNGGSVDQPAGTSFPEAGSQGAYFSSNCLYPACYYPHCYYPNYGVCDYSTTTTTTTTQTTTQKVTYYSTFAQNETVSTTSYLVVAATSVEGFFDRTTGLAVTVLMTLLTLTTVASILIARSRKRTAAA
jgi:hypothetical protein